MATAEGTRFRENGLEAEPSLNESTLSRIARVVFQTKPATLSEIARALSVSRTTAIRWIALMESEDLLSRNFITSGGRGRPRGFYSPTKKLMKVVKARSSGSIAILDFQVLKGACKHLVEDSCGFRVGAQLCAESLCPLIHS